MTEGLLIGMYNIIYADPPWRYEQRKVQGAAENHYPTMSIDELCALPVPELAAKDCALFLWATFPQLPEALRLIRATCCVTKGILKKLCGLPNLAIAVEQSSKEWNLLYFIAGVLRIRQYHIAVKTRMRTIVIPILQVLFYGKPKLIFVGKDDFIQTLRFDRPDEVFHP